jgi:mono/diheme cytochrome c family protein
MEEQIMKRTMKKLSALILLSTMVVFLLSMVSVEYQKPWDVPAKYKEMKNPTSGDEESIKAGTMLYKKHCASCHGKTGKGDGVKARQLETFPGDMTLEAFKSQSDGEVFYKSMFGRDEMPSYENKIEEEDLWHIVNYMKTF